MPPFLSHAAAILVVALVASPLRVAAAAPTPDDRLDAAWALAAQFNFEAAHREFVALAAVGDERSREARYGAAVTLLNLQPKTRQRVLTADRMLAEVLAGGTADEVGIAAAYFRARILDLHLDQRDPAAALAAYEALAAAHPDHFYGQMALLKAARVDLLLLPPGDDLAARVRVWAERARGVQDDVVRRNFENLLMLELLEAGAPPTAVLPHARAAQAGDFSRHDLRQIMLLRLARAARLSGEHVEADQALRKFLDEFPRSTLRQALQAELEASPARKGRS